MTLVIAQSGLPLTIAEHDTIISKIKTETECARKEFLEAMDVMPKSMSLLFCIVIFS